MKKTLISLILTPILLFGFSIGAHAYAGSAEDPLISKSFAQEWANSLLNDLLEQGRVLVQSFEERYQTNSRASDTPQKQYALTNSSTIRMYEGASITVTEGTAKVDVIKGEFVNVTVGGAAIDGRLLPGHLYIVCTNGEALVTATSNATFNIEGSFTVTMADGTTATATPSPTPVVTPSPTPVITPSPTPVVTPSPTPVVTPSPTPMVTPSPTPMVTPSPTPVVTPSPTPMVTPTPVIIVIEPTPIVIYIPVTPSPTPVIKPSVTPTFTVAPTVQPTVTPAVTPTPSPKVSVSPTVTPTPAAGNINFKDVSAQAWFYNDLRACVRMGILSGVTKTEFKPSSELTLAQAVAMAARMHQLYNEEEITLKNHWFGLKWYKTYVKYAVEHELVDESCKKLSRKEMNTPITRGEFIELLYKVLPEEEFKVINDIADNAIPDVKHFSDGADAIYAMYRAGIVTGYTDTPGVIDHTFKAHEPVKRSEAAVTAARMMESTRRVEFTVEEQ